MSNDKEKRNGRNCPGPVWTRSINFKRTRIAMHFIFLLWFYELMEYIDISNNKNTDACLLKKLFAM